MIKTIKADGSEKEFLAGMKKRSSEVNAEVEKTVRAIIDDVAARGCKGIYRKVRLPRYAVLQSTR